MIIIRIIDYWHIQINSNIIGDSGVRKRKLLSLLGCPIWRPFPPNCYDLDPH